MNTINKSSQLLSKFGLRKTSFREELISLFLKNKTSLAVDEIRRKIESSKDKVTVYRALDVFEKNGIIHKVPDKENLLRYALCVGCSANEHIHNHVHFICEICNKTYCLDDIVVPKISAPKGFFIKESETILKGFCESCK